MNYNGLEKSARLLMLLGSQKSSEVIKLLNVVELEKIVSIMLNLKKNSSEDIQKISFECIKLLQEFKVKEPNVNKYIFSMLSKALGDVRANDFLNNIHTQEKLVHNVSILNKMKATEIVELFDSEHPQIIAITLIHLEHYKRSKILSLLPDKIGLEVILRIASFSELNCLSNIDFLNVINVLLTSKNKNSNSVHKKNSVINKGVDLAVKLINSLNNQTRMKVINKMNQIDTSISRKILHRILLFKDLYHLSDLDMQILLKEIDAESIYIALYNMNKDIQDKFLKNMSQDQLCYVKDQKKMNNIDVSDDIIINRQNFIIKIVKILVKHNKISINDLEKKYV